MISGLIVNKLAHSVKSTPANQIPFDNSANGFTATDVQAAIEEARSISDFLAGYERIISSETITVPVRKQMITHGLLIIEGVLIVQGASVILG